MDIRPPQVPDADDPVRLATSFKELWHDRVLSLPLATADGLLLPRVNDRNQPVLYSNFVLIVQLTDADEYEPASLPSCAVSPRMVMSARMWACNGDYGPVDAP